MLPTLKTREKKSNNDNKNDKDEPQNAAIEKKRIDDEYVEVDPNVGMDATVNRVRKKRIERDEAD